MILDKSSISQMELESGDIFAVKGSGPVSWLLQNCVEPPTDRFHFGLVWIPTDNGADRVILESQGQGGWLETLLNLFLHVVLKKAKVGQAVAVGRLSFYHGQDIEFYRPTTLLKTLRRQAPGALSSYGREGYGYIYITKLVVRGLWKWLSIAAKERRFRRLRVEEIPWVEPSKALICTVAPDIGYQLIGADLIPPGITSTPNAYAKLVQNGVLTKIGRAVAGAGSLGLEDGPMYHSATRAEAEAIRQGMEHSNNGDVPGPGSIPYR